jgi:hypothetical protein
MRAPRDGCNSDASRQHAPKPAHHTYVQDDFKKNSEGT